MAADPVSANKTAKDLEKSCNSYSFHKKGAKQKSSFCKALKFACQGFVFAFLNGARIKNMLVVTALVIAASIFLNVSLSELVSLIVLCGAVISLELMNTAVEAAVDIASPEYSELAKVAKDCASGSVLVMSVASAVVGLIIFAPKVLDLITGNLN